MDSPVAGAVLRELERRADELLGELTCDEKLAMLHQWSPGVPRLGIGPFRTGSEVLHGVAWLGEATVFPQAIGLAATWDPDLLTAVGAAVAGELRALHQRDPSVSLTVWAPVVNLLRDPRWGRNEEGYSEDPLLTARLAVAYCAGLRGDHPVYWRTAPILKHFLAYNHETQRDTTSSTVRARVLHEYELPPFRAPIQAGVAAGVMPSYNLVNGRPNHVSPYLNQLLRSWTPDELVVCSDAYAPSNLVATEHYFADHPASHAAALRAGVDSFTDQGDDPTATVARLSEALRQGLISGEDVDRAVRRLLLLRFRLGEFDSWAPPPEPAVPQAPALDSPAHRELARRAARQAIVLLKNDGGALPLEPAPGLRLAVVGPFADTLRADWYSGTMPYQVTVAAGLREALAGPGAGGPGGTVTVTEGADRVRLGGIPGVRGLPGVPRDAGVPGDSGEFDVFDWGGGVVTLRSVATGRFLTEKEDGSLVADQERPNGWVVRETFILGPAGGQPGLRSLRSAATGSAHRISWEVLRRGADAAAQAAAAADVCVIVVGNDPLVNGRETEDRATLALPPAQDRLIRAASAACPRSVLVVMSSYPYALGWAADQLPAIAWTSHAGQETGHALADVLLGTHAPAGRLTQTWYRGDADLPGLLDYDIIKSRRTYLYFGGRPLYPFGHGLGYTTFGYRALRLDPAELPDPGTAQTAEVTVTVDVTNTGTRAGTEVVQCYAAPVAPRRPGPRPRWPGSPGSRWRRARPGPPGSWCPVPRSRTGTSRPAG